MYVCKCGLLIFTAYTYYYTGLQHLVKYFLIFFLFFSAVKTILVCIYIMLHLLRYYMTINVDKTLWTGIIYSVCVAHPYMQNPYIAYCRGCAICGRCTFNPYPDILVCVRIYIHTHPPMAHAYPLYMVLHFCNILHIDTYYI